MIKRVLKSWILTSFVIFIACAASFMGVQQVLRQSANDPQIQIAEDIAQEISSGADPSFSGFLNNSGIRDLPGEIDPLKSLDTVVIVYNSEGNIISSNISGYINSSREDKPQLALINSGMLDYAKSHGENRLTWEPGNNIRLATVIVPFNFPDLKAFNIKFSGSGYVLVARNLRETEKRIQNLTMQYAMGFVGAVIADFVLIFGLEILFKENKK